MKNKIRKFFKKLNQNKAAISVVVILFGIIIATRPVLADSLGGKMNVAIGKIIFSMNAALLTFVGKLFQGAFPVIMNLTGEIVSSEVVTTAWKLIRDFVNMFFIFFLLFVSIEKLVGQESKLKSGSAAAQIVKILIAAFLINFSKVIFCAIIDFTQIFTMQFVNAFSGRLPGLKKVFELDSGKAPSIVLGIVFGICVLCFMAFALSALLLILIRAVALSLYVALSPLWFLVISFPVNNNMIDEINKQVVKKFFTIAMQGPILGFYLWFAMLFLSSGSSAMTASERMGMGDTGAEEDAEINPVVVEEDEKQNVDMSMDYIMKVLVASVALLFSEKQAVDMAKEAGTVAGKGLMDGVVNKVSSVGMKPLDFAKGIGTKAVNGIKGKAKDLGTLTKQATGNLMSKTGSKIGLAAGATGAMLAGTKVGKKVAAAASTVTTAMKEAKIKRNATVDKIKAQAEFRENAKAEVKNLDEQIKNASGSKKAELQKKRSDLKKNITAVNNALAATAGNKATRAFKKINNNKWANSGDKLISGNLEGYKTDTNNNVVDEKGNIVVTAEDREKYINAGTQMHNILNGRKESELSGSEKKQYNALKKEQKQIRQAIGDKYKTENREQVETDRRNTLEGLRTSGKLGGIDLGNLVAAAGASAAFAKVDNMNAKPKADAKIKNAEQLGGIGKNKEERAAAAYRLKKSGWSEEEIQNKAGLYKKYIDDGIDLAENRENILNELDTKQEERNRLAQEGANYSRMTVTDIIKAEKNKENNKRKELAKEVEDIEAEMAAIYANKANSSDGEGLTDAEEKQIADFENRLKEIKNEEESSIKRTRRLNDIDTKRGKGSINDVLNDKNNIGRIDNDLMQAFNDEMLKEEEDKKRNTRIQELDSEINSGKTKLGEVDNLISINKNAFDKTFNDHDIDIINDYNIVNAESLKANKVKNEKPKVHISSQSQLNKIVSAGIKSDKDIENDKAFDAKYGAIKDKVVNGNIDGSIDRGVFEKQILAQFDASGNFTGDASTMVLLQKIAAEEKKNNEVELISKDLQNLIDKNFNAIETGISGAISGAKLAELNKTIFTSDSGNKGYTKQDEWDSYIKKYEKVAKNDMATKTVVEEKIAEIKAMKAASNGEMTSDDRAKLMAMAGKFDNDYKNINNRNIDESQLSEDARTMRALRKANKGFENSLRGMSLDINNASLDKLGEKIAENNGVYSNNFKVALDSVTNNIDGDVKGLINSTQQIINLTKSADIEKDKKDNIIKTLIEKQLKERGKSDDEIKKIITKVNDNLVDSIGKINANGGFRS